MTVLFRLIFSLDGNVLDFLLIFVDFEMIFPNFPGVVFVLRKLDVVIIFLVSSIFLLKAFR